LAHTYITLFIALNNFIFSLEYFWGSFDFLINNIILFFNHFKYFILSVFRNHFVTNFKDLRIYLYLFQNSLLNYFSSNPPAEDEVDVDAALEQQDLVDARQRAGTLPDTHYEPQVSEFKNCFSKIVYI